MSNAPENDIDPTQEIVNKIAASAISSQLESASKIDVNLNSKVPNLLQGKAEAVKITGEKIVVVEDIQLEKIDLACQDLSLNLTQAILGKIAFDRPGNFQVKLIFTQTDCDRLLNSDYVKVLLQNLSLDLDSQPANFYLQQGICSFDDSGDISLTATIVLRRSQQTKTARFKIIFRLDNDGSAIEFISGKYLGKSALDWDETAAVMNKAGDLLYLRHFANEDLCFTLNKIRIQNRQLIIQADTQIDQLPDSLSQSFKSVCSEINNNDSSDKI